MNKAPQLRMCIHRNTFNLFNLNLMDGMFWGMGILTILDLTVFFFTLSIWINFDPD